MKNKIILAISLLTTGIAFSQTPEERAKIVSNYDLEHLNVLEKELIAQNDANQKDNIEKMARLGVRESYVDEAGSYYNLKYFEGDTPIYVKTDNVGSALTARVNTINYGGSEGLNLNGQNMIVGVWDGGPIRGSHVELAGRITYKDGETFFVSNGGTRHGTHVAGTIISSGVNNANSKGLAYQAQIWGNTFDNDEPEVVNQIGQGLLVSNHSYGIPAENAPVYYLGAYINESSVWDQMHFNAPYYQAVISAGNDRGSSADTKGGRDLLVGNKNSKNPVVVAAVAQVSNYTGPSSVNMSSFSSWGPTDDYRIKPDISAKGVSVFSTVSDTDTSYDSMQGTSMAAPAVAATLTLYQQYYNQLYASYMKAATLKAVMINSADEAGATPGPDYKFGWGLINAKRATQIIGTKNSGGSIIEELNLANGQTYTKSITSDGVSPLRVTVVWTDPAGPVSNGTVDDPTSRLVNDLDVRVVQNNNVTMPWVLNSFFIQAGAIKADNPYDNVESIDVDLPSGTYDVIVTHKGTLQGGNQNFSLVVSGVNQTLSSNSFSNVFSVYPNPVNDILNVTVEGAKVVVKELSVFDSQGRLVKFVDMADTVGTHQVDLSELNSGIYMVEMKGENGERDVKRIIKK
ncbi:S8 family serine peptidase [Flavobacterium chuncheonense]|uniref:S8 family serine peptidase n=1 Tax=Flavobacterium chuncheonense TaxID=2026653 RepID=A0ABW5YL16_9FLAO